MYAEPPRRQGPRPGIVAGFAGLAVLLTIAVVLAVAVLTRGNDVGPEAAPPPTAASPAPASAEPVAPAQQSEAPEPSVEPSPERSARPQESAEPAGEPAGEAPPAPQVQPPVQNPPPAPLPSAPEPEPRVCPMGQLTTTADVTWSATSDSQSHWLYAASGVLTNGTTAPVTLWTSATPPVLGLQSGGYIAVELKYGEYALDVPVGQVRPAELTLQPGESVAWQVGEYITRINPADIESWYFSPVAAGDIGADWDDIMQGLYCPPPGA